MLLVMAPNLTPKTVTELVAAINDWWDAAASAS